MTVRSKKMSQKLQKITEQIHRNVANILADEAKGEEDAFADWLHTFYLGGLDGERLTDFEKFKESPLAADMIADWKHECASHDDRVGRECQNFCVRGG